LISAWKWAMQHCLRGGGDSCHTTEAFLMQWCCIIHWLTRRLHLQVHKYSFCDFGFGFNRTIKESILVRKREGFRVGQTKIRLCGCLVGADAKKLTWKPQAGYKGSGLEINKDNWQQRW
jgi:hypothetical protein